MNWRNTEGRYGSPSIALFRHRVMRDNTLRRMLPGCW